MATQKFVLEKAMAVTRDQNIQPRVYHECL